MTRLDGFTPENAVCGSRRAPSLRRTDAHDAAEETSEPSRTGQNRPGVDSFRRAPFGLVADLAFAALMELLSVAEPGNSDAARPVGSDELDTSTIFGSACLACGVVPRALPAEPIPGAT